MGNLGDDVARARATKDAEGALASEWQRVHGVPQDNAVAQPQGDWADFVREAVPMVGWHSALRARDSSGFEGRLDHRSGLAFRRLYDAPDGTKRLSGILEELGEETWASRWLDKSRRVPLPGSLVRVVSLRDDSYGGAGEIFQLTETGLMWALPEVIVQVELKRAGFPNVRSWARHLLVDWLASGGPTSGF